jgi:uncharacterized protein YndB with AHSA1/START domain
MDEQKVVKERIIQAPVMAVWKAVTTAEEMSKWFFELHEFKAELGYEFQLIGEKDGKKYPTSCKIIEVVERERLLFTWRYDDFPGEQLVSFELFDMGESCKFRVTHSGLENMLADQDEFDIEDTIDGWEVLTQQLKQLVEAS